MPTVLVMHADEPIGDYSLVRFFLGDLNKTKQLAGELRLHIGELQIIGAALSLGAERMQEHLRVEHRGYLSQHRGEKQ